MYLTPRKPKTIRYPDSDGQPMAENTRQFRWIVTIQGNLDLIFRAILDVFVAGDNLWYPVEGQPEIRQAPDVHVVFGRPKGDRGSYKQWQEGGIPLTVVFEVLSPGNRTGEMMRKFHFYERYGVEEYYIYDPDTSALTVYVRTEGKLREIEATDGWVSPRFGIRFDTSSEDELVIYGPNDSRFLTFVELGELAVKQGQRADEEGQRANEERLAREQAQQRADAERARADRLAEQLRSLGIDPNS